jgi:tetratricopeptide (TPR) repeat protein
VDAYLSRWTARRAESCEATHVRQEQPLPVLDARQACLARRLGAVKALTRLFSSADAQVVERAVQATASLPDLDACAAAAVPPAGAPAEDAAKAEAVRTRIEEANALHVTGKYAQALPLLNQALAEARAMKDRALEYEALYVLALQQRVTQAHADAERTLYQALEAAQASRDDRAVAQAAVLLVSVLGEIPRLDQAHQWAGFARAALERIGGNALLEAELHTSLGSTFFSERRFPEALEAQQRALRQYEALYGPEHVHLVSTVNGIAGSLMELNRFDEALVMEERTIHLLERNLGPEHPSLANALNNLGAILSLRGQPAEGLVPLQRAMAITEKTFGPEHLNVATSLGQMALLYQALGRMPEGVPLLERQIAILDKHLKPEDPGLVLPLTNLASFLAAVKRYPEELAVSQRAVRIAEKSYGPQSPSLMFPLLGLAGALVNLQRPAEAIPYAERVLAASEAPGTYRGMRTSVRHCLALALVGAGRDRARARKLAEEAIAIGHAGGPQGRAEVAEIEAWLARGMPAQ